MEKETSDLIYLTILLRSLRRWQTAAGAKDVLGPFNRLTIDVERNESSLLEQAEALSMGTSKCDESAFAVPQTRMESILEMIGRKLGHNQSAQYALNTKPISLAEESFPVLKNEAEGTLNEVYSQFARNLINLQTGDIEVLSENLLSLMQRFAVCVPSSARTPDVSLFDQARTAAAIAHCLFRHRESCETGTEEFLLVGGDFSGIQRYIYQIASKHAAKNLKGRSFYLTLLSDAIVRHLLSVLHVHRANIVYNSGGCFYLLAPNTKDTRERLETAIDEIERSIFCTHGIQLFVVIDSVPLSRQELINQGARTLSEVWGDLFEKRDKRKSHKYAKMMALQNESFCTSKGLLSQSKRSPFASQNESFFKPSATTTHIDAITGDDLTEACDLEGIGWVSPITKDQITLGGCLRSAVALVVCDEEIELFKQNELVHICPASLSQHYYLLKAGSLDLIDDLTTTVTVVHINGDEGDCAFTLPASASHHKHALQFYGGNWFNGKTLEDMCGNDAEGDAFARLGILRMDVDNLGSIFQKGIPQEKASLARFAALSRSFDHFFCGYINTICSHQSVSSHCFIVYAGGDDLFIVGRWDVVIQVAHTISTDFERYTCGNPAFSISGGVAILGAKFPVAMGALLSAEEEERAKGHKLKDARGKNSISFLGMPLHWKVEFPEVERRKMQLVRLIKNNELPKAFLSNVMQRAELAVIRQHRVTNVRVFWLLAYEAKRMRERTRSKEAKTLLDDFIKEIADNRFGSDKSQTAYHALELWAFTARWAEFEYRTTNNNDKKPS